MAQTRQLGELAADQAHLVGVMSFLSPEHIPRGLLKTVTPATDLNQKIYFFVYEAHETRLGKLENA